MDITENSYPIMFYTLLTSVPTDAVLFLPPPYLPFILLSLHDNIAIQGAILYTFLYTMVTYFLNHKVYTHTQAEAFSLYSQAFKYGDGLFETVRIYNEKPLFLSHHFRRLFSGMYFLKYRFHEEKFEDLLMEGIYRVLVSAKYQHARLRIQVFRRENILPPEFVIECTPIEDYYSTIHTLSLTDFRLVPLYATPYSGFKVNNRLSYQLASLYAIEEGFDEAVLYNDKYAGETSNFNLFIVKNRKVYTPPLSIGCLNGIMRFKTLQLCQTLGISIKEKKLTSSDLAAADEIFLTNIIRGIVPIEKYNHIVWENEPYPITSFLKQNWNEMIRLL
jgi:branched-chain amino acid aminotransferase